MAGNLEAQEAIRDWWADKLPRLRPRPSKAASKLFSEQLQREAETSAKIAAANHSVDEDELVEYARKYVREQAEKAGLFGNG